ncbi:interleukin-10 receptor subunit beta isoform X1 [Erinaceus europaeus]|uniref:Interleukin-10 receptor subunit beta n=1 Tax=Erinaceus europaeus TaxID=9365 RepID=A0A1S2ZI99_ERIEU|nr:interleukin-10 receptor subunit beta isoform X1 [Erinaceus europaeus]
MARILETWLGCCLLVSAFGMVPPPENIRVNSVNFKSLLQWDTPALPQGNLTFTVQFLSYQKFQDMCTNTKKTECNFSSLSKYGEHTLRVRTESEGNHSIWVNVTFCPVEETLIGPVGMQVNALSESLYIHLSSPQVENEPEGWTLKSVYSAWAYHVLYWKNGSDGKIPLMSQHDSLVLQNLEPWTTYCVQAQAFVSDRNKTGKWNEPVCEQTAEDGTLPSWLIPLLVFGASFCVALLLFCCVVLLWGVYRKTKYALWPRSVLPQHLTEFWSHPHHNTLLFFPLSEESEVFDKLSVVTQLCPASKQGVGDSGHQAAPEGADSGEHHSPLLPTPASESYWTGREAEAT